MKKFTKLVLATSVAFSANAMAMQAMDDASLSETTGQDGISIGIGISKIEIDKVFIHDNDGLNGGPENAGAIVIQGTTTGNVETHTLTNGLTIDSDEFGIYVGANYTKDSSGNYLYLLPTGNLADLTIDSDAGDGVGNSAYINIAAQVSGLEVVINEIGVTASNDNSTNPQAGIRRGGTEDNYNAILSGLSLVTGPMTAKIQLGAAPQGAMIKLNATMYGGLEIKNLGILDNSTKVGNGDGTAGNRAAGEIFIESIKVADKESTNLVLDQDIKVMGKEGTSNGYIQMISNSGAHDTYVKGVKLGSRSAASIGDIEVQGMQTYYTDRSTGNYVPGAVITIRGH